VRAGDRDPDLGVAGPVDVDREPHLEADAHHAGDGAADRTRDPAVRRHLDVVRTDQLVLERRDRAEEAHHEVAGRGVVQLVRRADLLDPAVVDHHDLVGDLERLLLVVRDEDGGDVHLVVQPAQPVAQLLAHLGVERAERLVEEQHGRLHREGARERHPLPLATRELRREPVRELAEVHQLQQLVDASLHLVLGRLRISSPNATFFATLMCLKAA
jgi:hypothetical protein